MALNAEVIIYGLIFIGVLVLVEGAAEPEAGAEAAPSAEAAMAT